MGKRRYLLWAVYSLATLASCNMDDDMPMPTDNAIRFNNQIWEPYVENLTRGSVTNKDNLSEFGVFAYYSATGSYNDLSSKPDYMYNIHVTRPEGTWIYVPLKFWPQGSVSFFAYTPHTKTDTNVSVICETGAPVVTYTVPDEVTDHRDLMLSAPALNHKKDGGSVMLTFRHALACIDFNARVDGTLIEGQSIKVTTISIGSFLHKASCNHRLADAITSTFTEDASDKQYTLSEAGTSLLNLPLTAEYQYITSKNSIPMLWPQMIDNADKLIVTAEYTSNGKTRKIVFERNIKEFVSEIAAGKRYIFNLIFSPLSSMTLTCTVIPWDTKTIEVPDFD